MSLLESKTEHSVRHSSQALLENNKKEKSSHPISPITRVITIRLTVEVLHAARDHIRFALIPKLQPLARMFLISIVNHSRCSFRPLASVAPDRGVDAASLEPAQFIGELVGRHSRIDIVRLSCITTWCRYTSSCVGRINLNVTISTIPHAVLIGSSSPFCFQSATKFAILVTHPSHE